LAVDAIAYLSNDHLRVQAVLAQLFALPQSESGSWQHPSSLRELVADLVEQLSKHEAVEEQYFWPYVERTLPDGPRLADKARSQERAGKALLDDVAKTAAEDPELPGRLQGLRTAVVEHVKTEQAVFTMLRRQAVGGLEELGAQLIAAKRLAPTHPHPHAPTGGTGAKVAGTVAGIVDRVRDAASG
jgi:hypothetical protein